MLSAGALLGDAFQPGEERRAVLTNRSGMARPGGCSVAQCLCSIKTTFPKDACRAVLFRCLAELNSETSRLGHVCLSNGSCSRTAGFMDCPGMVVSFSYLRKG